MAQVLSRNTTLLHVAAEMAGKRLHQEARVKLIIAEASLETIPSRILRHPAVISSAKRRGKKPYQLLLDRSLHHAAMRKLPFSEKRGRPDIVHFTLLEALGSPLNKYGLLELYVHTLHGIVIEIDPSTRLPKNYNRFIGLMEQLFEKGKVPPEGPPLLRIVENKGLSELVEGTTTFLLWERGVRKKLANLGEDIVSLLKKGRPVSIIVGGFPHGDFRDSIVSLAERKISIWHESLETWIVVSRVLTAIELALDII